MVWINSSPAQMSSQLCVFPKQAGSGSSASTFQHRDGKNVTAFCLSDGTPTHATLLKNLPFHISVSQRCSVNVCDPQQDSSLLYINLVVGVRLVCFSEILRIWLAGVLSKPLTGSNLLGLSRVGKQANNSKLVFHARGWEKKLNNG